MSVIAPYHRGLRKGSTMYGTPYHEIFAITVAHMRQAGPTIQAMMEVKDRYNADWVLPGFEDFGDLSPLIIADSIDNLGMAAAQIDPLVYCPPLDPMKQTGTKSIEYATMRRRMIEATLFHSAFDVGRGRAFRHLFGYSTYSMQVKADYDKEELRCVVRNPMTTYTEPKDPEDLTPPRYGSFISGMSGTALREKFPVCRQENGGPIPKAKDWTTTERIWDTVEWWDGDCIVIGLLGPRDILTSSRPIDAVAVYSLELFRTPNRFGFVPVICPTQVTFDKIMSSINRIVGRSDLLAKFTALDVMASEQAVFPDKYIIGRDGMTPRLVAGRWIDGREGAVNYIVDAAGVGNLRNSPDPAGPQAHDRLEGEAKRHVGLVPQMQGDTYGALRTGRGIDSLYSAAVDPRVAEAHRIMGHAMTAMGRAILTGYKAIWGSKSFSMFTGTAGDSQVQFTADKYVEVITAEKVDIEELVDRPAVIAADCVVGYPIPGTDVLNLTMALAQIKAMGLVPTNMLRRMHPWTAQVADQAERQVLVEEFENILKASLAQRMAPGQGIPPTDAATILEVLRETGDLVQAARKADELASERQAAQAPPPGDGQAASPDAMPGLGQPGEGGEMAPPPAIAAPNSAQENLRMLSRALMTHPPAGNTPEPAGAGSA